MKVVAPYRVVAVALVVHIVSTQTGTAVALPTTWCQCPTVDVHSTVGLRPDPSKLSYEVGATFEIYCHPSSHLVPIVQSTIVRCREDCIWSQDISEVECVERQCPKITEADLPANVTLRYDNTISSGLLECGALAVFGCPDGFELEGGPTYWRCECDGVFWSPSALPKCKVKTCGALSPPANAFCRSTDETNDFGTEVECICGPEFDSVKGSGKLVCDVAENDGNVEWVGQLQCHRRVEPAQCREPRNNDYSYSMMITSMSGRMHPVGTVIKYACLPGTDIVGNNVIVCNDFGQWTSDPPNCVVAECRHPSFADQSVLVMGDTKTSYLYGTRQRYACPPGYHLRGSAMRQCVGVDHWTGYDPSCKKLCPNPGIPVDSARTAYGPFYEGSKIVYECGRGRVLNGSRQITCQADGTWTDNIPSCRHVECVKPAVSDPRVMQRTPTYYSYWHNAVIQYICPKGYAIMGSKRRKCLRRGWTGDEPTCKKTE